MTTTKFKSFKELESLNKKEYKGKLPEYQQKGNVFKGKKIIQYETDYFNSYQNMLYNRALHGLKVYEQKDIKIMHRQKRKRIQKVHKRAQLSLNLMKQEYVINITNKIFQIWFPDNNFTNSLISMTDQTDPNFLNTLPLSELGIKKNKVIKRFIDEGILPKNFYQMK